MWGWLEPGREAQPRGVMDKIEQEIKATGSSNQEPPPPSLEKSLGFLAGLLSISRWVSLKLQLVYRALKERAVTEAGGLGAVRLKLLRPECSETTSEPAVCSPLLTPCLRCHVTLSGTERWNSQVPHLLVVDLATKPALTNARRVEKSQWLFQTEAWGSKGALGTRKGWKKPSKKKLRIIQARGLGVKLMMGKITEAADQS